MNIWESSGRRTQKRPGPNSEGACGLLKRPYFYSEEKESYLFTRAAVTSHHKLGDLGNRNLLSHNPGG